MFSVSISAMWPDGCESSVSLSSRRPATKTTALLDLKPNLQSSWKQTIILCYYRLAPQCQPSCNSAKMNYHLKKPHRLYGNLNSRREAPKRKFCLYCGTSTKPRTALERTPARLLRDLHKTSDGSSADCCASTKVRDLHKTSDGS